MSSLERAWRSRGLGGIRGETRERYPLKGPDVVARFCRLPCITLCNASRVLTARAGLWVAGPVGSEGLPGSAEQAEDPYTEYGSVPPRRRIGCLNARAAETRVAKPFRSPKEPRLMAPRIPPSGGALCPLQDTRSRSATKTAVIQRAACNYDGTYATQNQRSLRLCLYEPLHLYVAQTWLRNSSDRRRAMGRGFRGGAGG